MEKKFGTIDISFDTSWEGTIEDKVDFVEHSILLFTDEENEAKDVMINIKSFEEDFLVVGLAKVNGLHLVFDFKASKSNPKEALNKGVWEIWDALKKWYEKHTISPKTLHQQLRHQDVVEGQEYVLKNATGDYYQISFWENVKMVKAYVDINLLANHLVSVIKDALYEAFNRQIEKELLHH